MTHFPTARIILSASLLALATLGAQAAVPSDEDNGPVRQACPQIDNKLQQALDLDVRKLEAAKLARIEFTVKEGKVSQLRQQDVPLNMRGHVRQAMRDLKCQTGSEQVLAFHLKLQPN